MSLRVKLIITYVIMLVVSVAIIVFSGVGLVTKLMSDTAKSLIGGQTVEEASGRILDIIVDMRYTQKYQPKTLSQDSFAEQIAEQLSVFGGFLVVKNNNQFKAYGVENFDASLYSVIDSVTTDYYDEPKGFNFGKRRINWNNDTYYVIKYSFNENTDGLNYFFLIKVKDAGNMVRHNNWPFFILLVILTAIIIGPLLLITTRDIVIPLRKLENCAKEIAKGNLEFQLNSKSSNEIGSVIRSYEIMRVELKKSINRQLLMEENRKQLLSNITHDLKTPITSIKGYIQGIRDGVANDPVKLSKYLDVIYTKSDDMNGMIDDLFLFSKLDLGKEPFNKDNISVEDFYESCMQELHLELDNKGVELESECQVTEGLKVLMDSQKIKRVILNVVSNSMKFMDKDTRKLNMAFLEQESSLVIKIRDNGIGIDQIELEKIFDRFYRTDPSRNKNTGGSGLGLAIAKQIVEQHNGIIKADSKKGEWTEISINIPVNR